MKWQNTLDELCEQSRLFVACELELEIIPLNANIREATRNTQRRGVIRIYRVDKNRSSPNLQMLYHYPGVMRRFVGKDTLCYDTSIHTHTRSQITISFPSY